MSLTKKQKVIREQQLQAAVDAYKKCGAENAPVTTLKANSAASDAVQAIKSVRSDVEFRILMDAQKQLGLSAVRLPESPYMWLVKSRSSV